VTESMKWIATALSKVPSKNGIEGMADMGGFGEVGVVQKGEDVVECIGGDRTKGRRSRTKGRRSRTKGRRSRTKGRRSRTKGRRSRTRTNHLYGMK
jgi:hypothetical protein